MEWFKRWRHLPSWVKSRGLVVVGFSFSHRSPSSPITHFLSYHPPPLPSTDWLQATGSWVRASPMVLSTWLQTVKFIVKKWKCARFFAPNSSILQWLVNGAPQLCTSKKECNKLDLNAAQYFWLVNHNNWSRRFAISSPHIYAVLVSVLLVGLPKKS